MSQLTKLYHIEAVYDSKHLNFAGKSAMIHRDQAHLFSNKMEVSKYKCHIQDVMGYVNCNEGKSIYSLLRITFSFPYPSQWHFLSDSCEFLLMNT